MEFQIPEAADQRLVDFLFRNPRGDALASINWFLEAEQVPVVSVADDDMVLGDEPPWRCDPKGAAAAKREHPRVSFAVESGREECLAVKVRQMERHTSAHSVISGSLIRRPSQAAVPENVNSTLS